MLVSRVVPHRLAAVGRLSTKVAPNFLARFSTSPFPRSQQATSGLPLPRVSMLPNGVRVATVDVPGPTVAVGMLVSVGYRDESEEWVGVSHLVDKFGFRTTEKRDEKAMLQDLMRLGSTFSCLSDRETIMYTSRVFRHHIPEALELISDTVLHPVITEADLDVVKGAVEYELENLQTKSPVLLLEMLHESAFGGKSLGRKAYCSADRLAEITVDKIRRFRQRYVVPERLVVAAVGCDHDFFVEQAAQHLGHLKPSVPIPPTPKQLAKTLREERIPVVYQGGDAFDTREDKEGLVQLGLAFDSVSIQDPDAFAAATISVLLGGGGSFSSGGPGKGLRSRFYTNVVCTNLWIDSLYASNQLYSDTGLFTITGAVAPSHVISWVDVVAQELREVTKSISEEELLRSRNQLRSSLLMQYESRAVFLEEVLKQVQFLGGFVTMHEMVDQINKLTRADLVRVANQLFVDNKPTTFATCGPYEHNRRKGVFSSGNFCDSHLKK